MSAAWTAMARRRLGRFAGRGWLVSLSVTGVVVGSLGFLWPVLMAPVTADERYQYLLVPGYAEGSWTRLFTWTYDEIPFYAAKGRVTPFGFLLQRLAYTGVTKASVSTGTDIVIFHAVLKLLLLAAGVACFVAMLRALRARTAAGAVVGLSGRTVAVAALVFSVLLTLGAQVQDAYHNAWTAYPLLTYGAVAVIFGTVALTLGLASAVARDRRWIGPTVVVMVLLAVFLNTSYELYYVAFPAALFGLLLHAVRGETRRERWLPKLVSGGSLAVAFLGVFAVIRHQLSVLCQTNDCYVGVQPAIGPKMVTTAGLNLVSAVPGSGWYAAIADLRHMGMPVKMPAPFGGYGWLAAVVLVASVVVLLSQLPRPARAVTERRLVLAAGAVGLAVAFGTALVMAVSSQAQELITGPGLPYRNTVVTWAALAAVGTTIVLLLELRPALPRWAPVVPLAVFALAVGAVVVPVNNMLVRANRAFPSVAIAEDIQRNVVVADRTRRGETQRCSLFVQLRGSRVPLDDRKRIVRAANLASEQFNRVPFCSDAEDNVMERPPK